MNFKRTISIVVSFCFVLSACGQRSGDMARRSDDGFVAGAVHAQSAGRTAPIEVGNIDMNSNMKSGIATGFNSLPAIENLYVAEAKEKGKVIEVVESNARRGIFFSGGSLDIASGGTVNYEYRGISCADRNYPQCEDGYDKKRVRKISCRDMIPEESGRQMLKKNTTNGKGKRKVTKRDRETQKDARA